MRYAVVVEAGETGFGAYVPDLPGCVAAGAIPPPSSTIEFVDVAA